MSNPEDAVDHPVQQVSLFSGAWYQDRAFTLRLPSDWKVSLLSPQTPPELDDESIAESFRHPVGQARIRELAIGCRRPVLIVDDITRPTPAARVLPFVLQELEAAGVPGEQVTIVMATGTHGPPAPGALEMKVGKTAASRCVLRAHDHRAEVVRKGRTSMGTPVFVNRDVARGDLVIGIGGVYPQHTSWFGGGSKLLLGVLGERSIANLHYRHWRLTGTYASNNEFRRDLDEVAEILGLRSSISLHVDEQRRVVRIVTGDHRSYYPEAVRFSRDAFRVPPPEGMDVVIANSFPMDTSLTFSQTKGTTPIGHAPPRASRVLVAACSEGDGYHGLFPVVDVPRFHYRKQWMRRQLIARAELVDKVRHRVFAGQGTGRSRGEVAVQGERPVHLYVPNPGQASLHPAKVGMVAHPSWELLVDRLREEQGHRRGLRAAVYTCAPLEVLDLREIESSRGMVHDRVVEDAG